MVPPMAAPSKTPFPTGRDLRIDELNQRRQQAVRLRLAGHTVLSAAEQSGLSMPTVIKAMAAFKRGGWEAVPVASRGKRPGQGRQLDNTALLRLLDRMQERDNPVWDDHRLQQALVADGVALGPRSVAAYRRAWGLEGVPKAPQVLNHTGAAWVLGLHELVIALPTGPKTLQFWVARERRKRLAWGLLAGPLEPALQALARHWQTVPDGGVALVGWSVAHLPEAVQRQWHLRQWPGAASKTIWRPSGSGQPEPVVASAALAVQPLSVKDPNPVTKELLMHPDTLTHLQRLEAESIHILREVVAEADNPVMLYSIGKDSAVMLHLARKAFYPALPPFPLLHIDTRWKFRDMYAFRARMADETGMKLLVHINPEGVAKDINPFTHGSAIHTDVMKTQGLKQALDKYGFDVAFGGARRDEEKSRAKERVFSFRSAQHRWDPKNQRPELWKLYNARKHKGESIRVFPLSNWTELDIWQYIYLNDIPIVPLYYAAERPVVERDGTLIMVDDERMPLKKGEVPMMKKVRFRTLGCYPLTGAIESEAATLTDIIREMLLARQSERQGRVIDHDSAASMEKKKQEGYF
jgi:sulfate adenylyltransferase subunit 2